MKTSKEILGLPLMCIKEGVERGVVTELIIDTANKCVGFLVTDTGTSYFGLQALPFTQVSGIGQSLVTTSTADSIKPLFKHAEALALGFCSANLIGSRVISFEGNIIGEVNEFTAEEQTGRILECQLADGSVIDAEKIINITPGYVFVGEMEVPEELRATIEGTSKVEPPVEQEEPKVEVKAAPAAAKPADPAPAEETKPAADNLLERLKSQAASADAAASVTVEANDLLERVKTQPKPKGDEEKAQGGDSLYARMNTQYAIGRTVSRNIVDTDGTVLAAKGEKVTQEMVDKLRKANKHIDLTLNLD